jgi:carbon storage regulator
MLVLTRKLNEVIVIGDDVRITVVEVAPGRVKLGIVAPKSIKVDRAEIHEQKMAAAATRPVEAPVIVNRIAEVLPTQPTAPLPNRINAVRQLRRKPK